MRGSLAGSGRLLRLGLRRDRVLLPVWVCALVLSCVSSVRATTDLYPDGASRVDAARAINDSPALVAIYGPIDDVHSLGALASFKLLLLGGVLVAMLCAVVVRRHTRVEEESGRAELLSATAIGRHALLAAVLGEAAIAALATGALTAVGNIVVGLDVGGSVAFGLAWAGLGLSAAGITALACQLSASARTCGGVAAAILGGAFVLRAVGDLSAGWLSWLSPFGWASKTQAYAGDRFWVFALPVLALAATTATAVLLEERRDLGAGLLAVRPGPSGAAPGLGSVFGLDVRLHRGGLVGWMVALVALGGVMSGVAPSAQDIAGSQSTQDLLERVGGAGALIDTFLAVEISFVAVAVTGFAISAVARAAGEEEDGRTEQVIATGGSRDAVLGSVTLVALVAPVLILLAFSLGAAVALGLQSGGVPNALGTMVPAALAPLPAVWTVAAIGLLLFGLRAGWAVLGWAVLGLFLLLGQVGELLGLPVWVVQLSPYGHVPRLPAESFAVQPELVLTAIAVALLVLGRLGYRARDVG